MSASLVLAPDLRMQGLLFVLALTPDAFKFLVGRRYNRVKKANGERGPQKLDQIDPASTADRLAAQHGVSPMERAELALELEAEVKAAARERQAHGMTGPGKALTQNSAEPLPSGESRQAIARIAGVSHDTIAKAKAIREDREGWTWAAPATLANAQTYQNLIKTGLSRLLPLPA